MFGLGFEKDDYAYIKPEQENWDAYFISADLFEKFDRHLTAIYPSIIATFRGEKTGWNPMFIIPAAAVKKLGVEKKFLVPYVKSPTEFDTLEFCGTYNNYLFVCDKLQTELKNKFSGANNWIKSFKTPRIKMAERPFN